MCSVKELHIYEIIKTLVKLLRKDLKTEFLKSLILDLEIETEKSLKNQTNE